MTDNDSVSNRRPLRPVLVIETIEGRRASAKYPITPDEYERQLKELESGGLRLPRRQA